MKITIKKSFFTLVLLMLFGCNDSSLKVQEKKVGYFYVRYDIECCTKLNLDTIHIKYNKEIKDSMHILNYIYTKDSITDTVTYKYQLTDKFTPEYLFNGKKGKNDEYLLFAKEQYQIKGKSFDVYKYALNPNVIDGCINHFWTPEIGVFISRSWTWKNFRKLQTNNDSINGYIDLLTELIYNDISFFSGCADELELVLKSDAVEFYSDKMKEVINIVNE